VSRLPLVVIDADVLGRRRTGDETHVANLLRELATLAPSDLRLAAVTRRPDLVPTGIEPLELPARSQILRMAYTLPRFLRRLGPALGHFQYAIPAGFGGPAVVTIHDLSFERERTMMGLRDRLIFRTVVPRAARRAVRVLTVSERTRRDIMEHYGLPEHKILVTPNGVDPAFGPHGPKAGGSPYALWVGALQARKDPASAIEAIALVPELRLVLAGPDRGGGRAVREAVERLGLDHRVDLLGYVDQERLAALYRGAACLVFPSRYEGFGLPLVEAMACGTPVVAARTGALPEVASDAALLVEPGSPFALARGIEEAIAERERLVAAGLERARSFSWRTTAERTLAVYRELL
jgi:glycosyltransferase involved in cell wall biosynthesis